MREDPGQADGDAGATASGSAIRSSPLARTVAQSLGSLVPSAPKALTRYARCQAPLWLRRPDSTWVGKCRRLVRAWHLARHGPPTALAARGRELPAGLLRAYARAFRVAGDREDSVR